MRLISKIDKILKFTLCVRAHGKASYDTQKQLFERKKES